MPGKPTEMVARFSMGKVVIVPAWTPSPQRTVTAVIEWPPPPRRPGRPPTRPVGSFQKLAVFLAARGERATEAQHRAAAKEAGLKFVDREWRAAYKAMLAELKLGRGRPIKYGKK